MMAEGVPEIFRNFIDGVWTDAESGATFEDIDPATGEIVGIFPRSGPHDVLKATAAARTALPGWKATQTMSLLPFWGAWQSYLQAKEAGSPGEWKFRH